MRNFRRRGRGCEKSPINTKTFSLRFTRNTSMEEIPKPKVLSEKKQAALARARESRSKKCKEKKEFMKQLVLETEEESDNEYKEADEHKAAPIILLVRRL